MRTRSRRSPKSNVKYKTKEAAGFTNANTNMASSSNHWNEAFYIFIRVFILDVCD